MKYEGKPCRNCGNTIRYIRNDGCVDCCNARSTAWKKAHPERAKELDRRATQRQTDGSAKKRLDPPEFRETNTEYYRRYWLAHRDEINARRRAKRKAKGYGKD